VSAPLLTAETRLSQALAAVPGALEYVIALKPHDFARLRNPGMRRAMAPRISLRRLAAIAGSPEDQLLHGLNDLGGASVADPTHEGPPDAVTAQSPAEAPAWMAQVDPARLPWVNLLSIDDVLGDPFPPISLAVRQLEPGRVLGIRHRWEPQPLYDIWQKMDLQWYARHVGEAEWHVFVHRPVGVPAFPIKPVVGAEVGQLSAVEAAARVVALAEQLRPGQRLEVTGATPAVVDGIRRALSAAHGELWEGNTSAVLAQAARS